MTHLRGGRQGPGRPRCRGRGAPWRSCSPTTPRYRARGGCRTAARTHRPNRSGYPSGKYKTSGLRVHSRGSSSGPAGAGPAGQPQPRLEDLLILVQQRDALNDHEVRSARDVTGSTHQETPPERLHWKRASCIRCKRRSNRRSRRDDRRCSGCGERHGGRQRGPWLRATLRTGPASDATRPRRSPIGIVMLTDPLPLPRRTPRSAPRRHRR
jgi:hypothetical protein